jgi:hypothetical protein
MRVAVFSAHSPIEGQPQKKGSFQAIEEVICTFGGHYRPLLTPNWKIHPQYGHAFNEVLSV